MGEIIMVGIFESTKTQCGECIARDRYGNNFCDKYTEYTIFTNRGKALRLPQCKAEYPNGIWWSVKSGERS